jgi:ATP/maltotriose-dependent transcriptional regulator MalT
MMGEVRSGTDQRVEQARAALRAGDAATARAAVEPLMDASGAVLEVLARADYLDLDFASAISRWERAYAAYRAAGDQLGAIRAARTLGGMYFQIVGDFAVCAGWQARAETLLETAGETSEHGWVALNAGMFEPDRAVKHLRFREALAQARAGGDVDLEVATLGYLGASLVHDDQVAEGMRLLDEALAALAGDEVDDFFVLEEVFCQLFSACEHAHDVARADQWIRMGEAIASRRQLPAVSAFCRTHYGGVLTAAGRYAEADQALTEAVRLWALGQRSSVLRGGAMVRLADLRVRQGRYEEAEQLLADLDPMTTNEAARPLAAVHLARGETALAREVLERALESTGVECSEAAPLLEVLVEVLIAGDDVPGATLAADHLAGVAAEHGNDYVRALAALGKARVCVATTTGDPRSCLREALAGFGRAQMPLETARARLELARHLADDEPEVALAEARRALDAFEGLEAARHADAAAALLRTLGVRPSTARAASGAGLTKRETEVLELLGAGLSNPEIADRLFISRKTVEHHVGNVLAKLGLLSRAEAAAYAARRPATIVGEPGKD